MALKGVKVLEFAGVAPAPFCGMILSDFGATVLRIDKVQNSSDLDIDVLANGKKSLAVNLKTSEGKDIIKSLAKKHDVLLEPFRPGVMEKLGLGPSVLLEENRKLIYARLTGFGQEGLYCKRGGQDINYLGLSGLLSMFGRAEEKPTFPVNLVAGFGGGGLMCATGILLALFERANSGLGQIVDCSMAEGASYLGSWLFRSQELPIWENKRGENLLDSGAHFYDVYETKDGKYLTVGAIEPHFYEQLLKTLEVEDVDYFDFKKGKDVFKKKFLEKTRDEWNDIFAQTDACASPVLGIDEVADFEGNRDKFVKKDNGIVIPKPGVKLSRTPGETQALKKRPRVGQDSFEILKGLGYSEDKIRDFNSNGIIKTYT
ncbi:PREDICTED: alpha-methylacyl-CoA racemase-like [Nicrophorus vespilloides]|uniref:Alpha-methylacyl-CoA racemase-like n=1 Tax=Nicrophorus vespilloides TaxID=110193 RepID=A0ABM1MH13_NICVS|nr:PREDICTED: alpha-methylacyl-CoA racemase-like [Nicrophorus vespilloides]